MSFGLLSAGSEDERAVKELLVLPEIWEGQRRDVDDVEIVADATFAGHLAAVFRQEGKPVGYVMFVHGSPGIVVQHTALLEAVRGKLAFTWIEEAHREVFLTTPTTTIVSHCPDWNASTRALAHKLGAHRVSHKHDFAIRDGRMQGATIYRLSCFDWACEHHESFQDVGEAWHEQVFSKLEPHHDEDAAHNGFLGLALAMAKSQPHKAISIYNAWSEHAGYAPGALVWADGHGHSLIDLGVAAVLNGPDGVLAVIPKCQP